MKISYMIGCSVDNETSSGKQAIETHQCIVSYIRAWKNNETSPHSGELNLRITIKEMNAHCSCFQVEFGGGDPLTLYGVWCAKLDRTVICTDSTGQNPVTPRVFFKAIFKAREAACAGA